MDLVLRACSHSAIIRASVLSFRLAFSNQGFLDVSYFLYLLMIHSMEGLSHPQYFLFLLITLCLLQLSLLVVHPRSHLPDCIHGCSLFYTRYILWL